MYDLPGVGGDYSDDGYFYRDEEMARKRGCEGNLEILRFFGGGVFSGDGDIQIIINETTRCVCVE